MKAGDLCIFYHSSCKVPAAVGVGKVVKAGYPDATQFDPKSDYYDATSPTASARWISVDLEFVEKFKEPVSLTLMRTLPLLADMRLLATGNRLSVIPITKKHFDTILKISK
jgi:predicted RNA-binding protein with PUA-like domain